MLSRCHLKRSLLVVILPVFLADVADAEVDKQQFERSLQRIEQEIIESEQRLQRRLTEIERLTEEVRLAELNIAEVATRQENTRQQIAENTKQAKELAAEKSSLSQDIKQQRHRLKQFIRAAYATTEHDLLKVLLRLDQGLSIDRQLTYLSYLSEQRINFIDEYSAKIARLASLEQQLEINGQNLLELASTQKRQNEQLQAAQAQQQIRLAQLEQVISAEKANISSLKEEQESLEQTLLELERQAEQQRQREREAQKRSELELSAQPQWQDIAQLKGQLSLPVNGKMDRLFGQRRQGQVRWNGVMFDVSEGDAVRSIANGIVLFADYLKGFGLVAVIDHGNGFMSVYGHNQALLVEPSQVIQSEQVISLAGRSGGRQRPELYFEFRHRGKALNPADWLSIR